jgi:phenylacetate-CoA ligase
MDHIPGIELSQIVQTTQTNLQVRLLLADGADGDHVWQTVHVALRQLLAEHKLGHVAVERAAEAPRLSPGGKYRPVVPLS